MDKLQPQTVYVPVQKHTGLYMKKNGLSGSVQYMQELPGVYPLTAGQLVELIAGWDFRVHATVHEYIKSKGIEI